MYKAGVVEQVCSSQMMPKVNVPERAKKSYERESIMNYVGIFDLPFILEKSSQRTIDCPCLADDRSHIRSHSR